jgi:hypothetical protein
MKVLVILYGQYARTGGYNYCDNLYTIQGKVNQEIATYTHFDFFKYIENKFNLTLDKTPIDHGGTRVLYTISF